MLFLSGRLDRYVKYFPPNSFEHMIFLNLGTDKVLTRLFQNNRKN